MNLATINANINKELLAWREEDPQTLSVGVVIGGLATGATAGIGTHEIAFPKHKQYDETNAILKTLQSDLADLENAQTTFTQMNITHSRPQANKKIEELQASIEVTKQQSPNGYNPDTDGAVSGLTGIACGAVTSILLWRHIASRLKKAAAADSRVSL